MPARRSRNQPSHPPLRLSGRPLELAEVEEVARFGRRAALSGEARRRISASNGALRAALAERRPIYGVNTGFGSLSRQRIDDDDLREVQRNLLRSHAAGVGQPLPNDVVRGMLLLLAASLARGASGVRPAVVEAVLGLLNAGVTPVVPATGSVGASGDLAPLAHACLVLIGEGHARLEGRSLRGGEALRRAGLTPIALGPKEGLALINGTHLMASQATLLVRDVRRLFDAALAACAMSIDANRATDAFLDPRVYAVRNHTGPAFVAQQLRSLLKGSRILPSHVFNDPRVQDPYSFRCAPAVLGAAWDLFGWVEGMAERELGAVTDNPLVFPASGGRGRRAPKTIVSAGNFHGMPIAIPLDAVALGLSHVAGIAERRVFTMLAAADPEQRLTPHLAAKPGLQSGLMITQYTAAACCNELARLAAPSTVMNVPTCAGMEDYNSFGPAAAAKARRAVELTASVVAIELLCAAEALERRRPLRSGRGVEEAHELVRAVVPRLTGDRPPAPDIAAIEESIRAGAFSEL